MSALPVPMLRQVFSVKLEKRCDIVGHTSEETFGLTLGSCAVICRAC